MKRAYLGHPGYSLRRKRQHLVETEGDVVRLRDGCGALEEVQDGLVTRFDGRDGNGHGEDARVIDEVGNTEVLDESGACHPWLGHP